MYFNNWETSVCTVYIHYDGPKKQCQIHILYNRPTEAAWMW